MLKNDKCVFFVLASLLACSFVSVSHGEVKRDSAGREIIEGPVSGSFYNNVHIVSDTVGVESYSAVTVINSVIEADVCIRTPGRGITVNNNILKCGLCVQFTARTIVDNTLINNRCSGRMTNRPRAF